MELEKHMNVNEKKAAQGYKKTPETCANCKHFECREYHFADFREGKTFQRVEVDGRGPVMKDPRDGREFQNFFTDTYRCAIGGFAVKKLATCKQWCVVPSNVAANRPASAGPG
jgi:hypothetical protein